MVHFQVWTFEMFFVGCILFCVQLLQWQPCTGATSCLDVPFQVPGFVLIHHVIQSFQGIRSSDRCLDKCSGDSSCHSINWYNNLGLCQINRGTHLSYPEGLVSNSTGQYMLYSGRPMVTCSNKYCSRGDICLMERVGMNYRCEKTCTQPLGLEDGRIADAQINASSYLDSRHSPHCGRLNKVVCWAGAWVPYSQNIEGEYLQVDLVKNHIISKVATQGRETGLRWTKKYYLSYSQDGINWQTYKYRGNAREEFAGNTDRTSVVTHTLPVPLKTRFIRVVVLDRTDPRAALRLELYGCMAE